MSGKTRKILTGLLILLTLCFVLGAGSADGEHGSADTALVIRPGETVTDSLEAENAQNYYCFTTKKAGYVTVTFGHARKKTSKASWGLKMAARGSIDEQGFFSRFFGLMMTSVAEKGAKSFTTARVGIPAGTYYLRVHSGGTYSGADYTLRVNFTASLNWETEPNDEASAADRILPDTEVSGALIRNTNVYCRPTDCYTFTLKEDAYGTLIFRHEKLNSSRTLWKVFLEDKAGRRVYSETFTGDSAEKTVSGLLELPAGKYTLSVSCGLDGSGEAEFSETPYHLMVRLQPDETTASGGVYSLDHAGKTATLKAPEKKTAVSLTVPATVRVNGIRYRVTAIADAACRGMKQLKELRIGKYVRQIGRKAFYSCVALKNITLLTKKLKASTVGTNAFRGIAEKAVVICPEGKAESYKEMLRTRGMGEKVRFR